MKYETAGDPITGLKWTRKTTGKIADALMLVDIQVSPNTVGKLLKKMGFSLRANQKKIKSGGKKITSKEKKKRNLQFEEIKNLREKFASKGCPIISVDAKKTELIGNFKNSGTAWDKKPKLVNDHDFSSYATGKGIPYGVYDTLANTGLILLGTTYNTPDFAVDSVVKWWKRKGSKLYPEAESMIILADSGGSNGYRSNIWKVGLQEKLCDQYNLSVTVCHYPVGASKWNPIEHRLFSEISKNWAGKPLTDYETMLKYIRTTKTSTGLKVDAYLMRRRYKKGEKISKERLLSLSLKKHKIIPDWNYTINSRR